MEISNELRKLVDPNNECCCEHCLSNKCKEWALKKGFKIYSSCKSSSISQDAILLWISPGENNEIETIVTIVFKSL